MNLGFTIAGSLIVVVSNAAIQAIIVGMTKFLKLDDTNRESSIKVNYSFWAQLINTGYILLILNGVIYTNQDNYTGELSIFRLAEILGFMDPDDTESFSDYN